MRQATKPIDGMSMLEAAGVLLIASTIVLYAAGIASYLHITIQLSRLLDSALHSNQISTFTITNEMPRFDEQVVQQQLLTFADSFEKNFAETLGPDKSKYRIEFKIASLNIQQETGVLNSVSILNNISTVRGTLVVPPSVDATTSMEQEFSVLAGTIGAPTIHAVPTAMFGRNTRSQFLGQSALIGVRLFYSISDVFTRNAITSLGILQESVAYDFGVAALRNEVRAL